MDDHNRRATATVTVNLTDLNERPYFDRETIEKVSDVDGATGVRTTDPIDYAENRRTAVVALAAIEPDGKTLDWVVTGANASAFRIDDIADGSGNRDRRELVFINQPDYEKGPESLHGDCKGHRD